jgi:hypothetical protein
LRFGGENESYKSQRAELGGGGAVLCVRLEETEKRSLLSASCGFQTVTCSGIDYEYQSAVRQWRLLCVWIETPLHLGEVFRDTSFSQPYLAL